jgi:DnaJ-class molecular chaperone
MLHTNKEKKHMELLGIKEYPFSEGTLKTAYRQKAFQFHPDTSQLETEEEMKKINIAYAYLIDCVGIENGNNDFVLRDTQDTDIFKLWHTCDHCSGRGYNKAM